MASDIQTISDAFEERIRVKMAESTAETYERALRKWVSWLAGQEQDVDIWTADKHHLRSYISDLLDEEYAPDTIKGRRAGVSKFYELVPQLANEGRIEIPVEPDELVNPNQGLDLTDWSALQADSRQEQELGEDFYYLTPDEKELMIEEAPGPEFRNELLFRLLYQTGLRETELAKTRLSDIDRDEHKITVRSKIAKNGKGRPTYYRKSLDPLLNQWLDGGYRDSIYMADQSRYLFPTNQTEHLTGNLINIHVVQAARNAGLQEVLYIDKNGNKRYKVTAHAFRHSFAIQSLLNGMDLKTLQELMGHRNLSTTEDYLDVIDQHKRRIASQHGAGVESVEDDGTISRPTIDDLGEERAVNRSRRR